MVVALVISQKQALGIELAGWFGGWEVIGGIDGPRWWSLFSPCPRTRWGVLA